MLALDGRFTQSFLTGLVASVNPCGFVLLPTYLLYFLGINGSLPGTQHATVRRALKVSAALSAGFLAVFLVIGFISRVFTTWLNEHAKYAALGIGLVLLVVGIAMLAGWRVPISTPKLQAGGRDRTVRSMFLYGIAYAVASIGCTFPLFSRHGARHGHHSGLPRRGRRHRALRGRHGARRHGADRHPGGRPDRGAQGAALAACATWSRPAPCSSCSAAST